METATEVATFGGVFVAIAGGIPAGAAGVAIRSEAEDQFAALELAKTVAPDTLASMCADPRTVELTGSEPLKLVCDGLANVNPDTAAASLELGNRFVTVGSIMLVVGLGAAVVGVAVEAVRSRMRFGSWF